MELSVDDILKEGKTFAAKVISRMIRNNCELLDDNSEQFRERVKVCMSCPHFGIVNPLPTVKLHGCTICNCPVVTKAKVKVMMRPIESVGESLNTKEVIFAPLVGKNFVPEVVRCSDKSKDRWSSVDLKYSDDKTD